MNEAEGTALTERQRYWLDHVQTCAASGKTIAEYAADQGVSASTMSAGKKLLDRQIRRHANSFAIPPRHVGREY